MALSTDSSTVAGARPLTSRQIEIKKQETEQVGDLARRRQHAGDFTRLKDVITDQRTTKRSLQTCTPKVCSMLTRARFSTVKICLDRHFWNDRGSNELIAQQMKRKFGSTRDWNKILTAGGEVYDWMRKASKARFLPNCHRSGNSKPQLCTLIVIFHPISNYLERVVSAVAFIATS